MIDAPRFANLFNRSDADDIARAMREYQKELLEASKLQQQQQANQAAMVANEAEGMRQLQNAQAQEAMLNDAEEKELDREAEMERTLVKEKAKNEREAMKMGGQPPV